MKEAACAEAASATRLSAPQDAALYEGRPELADTRRARAISQADLAGAAGIPRPHVSRIENRRTRIMLARAIAIADVLDDDVDRLFVRLVTLAQAAADRDLERTTLRAAVDAGKIVADRFERRGGRTRVYFLEENLDAQLAQLPACKVAECEAKALAPSGYCAGHKWQASHERIRRAIARPVDDRPWLTEDEVVTVTGRAWEVVHRAIAERELRSWKVGGCVIVPKSDVGEWDESLPYPGRRSQAWQDETDGMVSLYQAGKSSETIAKRAGRRPETVLRRLKARGVQIRTGGISSELARGLLLEAWKTGTGLARWQVENRGLARTKRIRKGLLWSPKPGRPRNDARPEWDATLERIRTLYDETHATEEALQDIYLERYGPSPLDPKRPKLARRTIKIALGRPV